MNAAAAQSTKSRRLAVVTRMDEMLSALSLSLWRRHCQDMMMMRYAGGVSGVTGADKGDGALAQSGTEGVRGRRGDMAAHAPEQERGGQPTPRVARREPRTACGRVGQVGRTRAARAPACWAGDDDDERGCCVAAPQRRGDLLAATRCLGGAFAAASAAGL